MHRPNKKSWIVFLVFFTVFQCCNLDLESMKSRGFSILYAGYTPIRLAAFGDILSGLIEGLFESTSTQTESTLPTQIEAAASELLQPVSFSEGAIDESDGLEVAPTLLVPNLLVGSQVQITGNVHFSGTGGVILGSSSNGPGIFNGFSGGFGSINLGGQQRIFAINSSGAGVYVETYGEILNGSIAKTGSGILQFTGTNSYTGGTSLLEGTLKVIDAGMMTPSGSLSMNSGVVFDISGATNNQIIGAFSGDGTVTLGSKTLTFGDSSNTSYTGVFGGAGLAEKSGSGTLTLTRSSNVFNNTGPGYALRITAGTVSGNVINLDSNIDLNGGTVLLNQTVNGTYTKSISNTGVPGSMTKIGSGLLTFPSGSTNTVKNQVTIQEGDFKINGTLDGGGGFTLGENSTLSGTGTIIQNCTFQGTISPGNSIGTLTLSGDHTFASTNRILIEFTPEEADRITNLAGNIAIENGAVLEVIPEKTIYNPFQANYDVVTTSSGTITGQFTLDNPYPLFFLVGLVYTPQSVQVDVECITFSNYMRGKNNIAIGSCLNGQDPPKNSDFYNVLLELRSFQTSEGLNFAINQLQPSLFTTLAITAQNSNWYYNNAIRIRLDALEKQCLVSDKIHAWISPLGSFSRQKFFQASPNYSEESLGVAFGLDTVYVPYCIFGITGGYNFNYMKWTENRGHARIQDAYAGVYMGVHTDHFAFDLIGNGSYNYFATSRHVEYSNYLYAENRAAHGTHLGWQGSGQAQISYFFSCGGWDFSPYAQSNYFYMTENAFTEHSANSLNLHIKEHVSDLWMYEGGLKISRCFAWSNKKCSPYVLFGEMREMRFKGAYYTASLNDTDCWFTVKGSYPSRNLFHTRAGLEWLLESIQTSFSFSYDARLNSAYFDQSLYVSGQYNF